MIQEFKKKASISEIMKDAFLKAGFKTGEKFTIHIRNGIIQIIKSEPLQPEKKI
jgi:hypothetical protein